MKDLNQRYRGVCGATDILSFRQGDHPFIPINTKPAGANLLTAGDIVIALDIMRSQASEFGVSEEEELKRLLVHGILHLEGMDHENADSSMMTVQEEIVKALQKERLF
jgi:probable rRNA maturation factor